MTHNNIITANNVIINYNNHSGEKDKDVQNEYGQGPNSSMPPGVHISGTGDMKITTDNQNANDRLEHPLSDGQVNTTETAGINA